MAFLERNANRGSVSTGHKEIDNSMVLYNNETSAFWLKSNNTHAGRTADGHGNGSSTGTKATFSFWHKRSGRMDYQESIFAASNSARRNAFRFTDAGKLIFYLSAEESGTANDPITTAVFRDPAAWSHYVFSFDTANATEGNRLRVWVNGVELTSWDTAPSITRYAQFTFSRFSSGCHHGWGTEGTYYHSDSDNGIGGYLAEVFYADGTAVTDATKFGMYNDEGVWGPIQPTASAGAAGYYLEFQNSGELGTDTSGKGNNFDENGLTAQNQSTDTPSNNFCTWNSLVAQAYALYDMDNGNLNGPVTSSNFCTPGTIAVSSGKWYWEGVTTSYSGTKYWQWGVLPVDAKQGQSADSLGDAGTTWYTADNAFYSSSSQSGQSVSYNTGFTGYTAGDIWSIALNCDTSPYQMTLRINNSVPGTANNNTNRSCGTYTSARAVAPCLRVSSGVGTNTHTNFGGAITNSALAGANNDANGYGNFKYAVPSGYFALCTKNLAEEG